MCNTCLSSNLSSEENFRKNVEVKDLKNARSNSWSILNPLFQLHTEWLTCMLIACLRTMGQAVSKNKSITNSLYAKKSLKILSNPWVLRCAILCLTLFYVGLPVCFYFCPWVRRGAVYMNFVDWPFQNHSSPKYYGLNNTHHFFVRTAPGISLGVWHVPPRIGTPSFLDDSQPVILYLHGSAESRSAAYRRSMYQVLSSTPINAHIITFDYRGFGDSTHISPTVKTLEEDATAMFHWLRQQIPLSRIILWGHSMGTGIAIRLGETFSKTNNSNPFAIVLEAPFTSVADATHTFPLSFFHRRLPFFQMFCSDRTRHPDTNMNSEDIVGRITAPLLVLHAADDSMVWSEQGRRIWKRAVLGRSAHLHRPVFIELDGKYGCGHRNIHRAPNLPFEVARFLRSVKLHSQIS